MFIRIHRFYIVSVSKIESYNHELVWIGKQELPISRMYRYEVEAFEVRPTDDVDVLVEDGKLHCAAGRMLTDKAKHCSNSLLKKRTIHIRKSMMICLLLWRMDNINLRMPKLAPEVL